MEKYSIKNEVDLLFEKIGKIQEKCEHRFYLLERYKPKDTLTKSVFRVEEGVMACCLDCSKRVGIDMTKMCPRCLGEMLKKKEKEGSVDELYSCKKCDFTVHQINRTKLDEILSA